MMERLVYRQLSVCLQSADLVPSQQSAYWPRYSTEMAILQVLSEILQAVDQGDIVILVLPDRIRQRRL